jgi:hypothetical protein
MTFDFHPEAETEVLEGIVYYESCAPGLGEDFSLEVYSTIQNILSYSHAWPIVEDVTDMIRKYLLDTEYGGGHECTTIACNDGDSR